MRESWENRLPVEVTRAMKFLLDRGALVRVVLTSTDWYRSPLMQGGLPCRLEVRMSKTVKKYFNNREV